MEQTGNTTLEERVAELEQRVESIQRLLAAYPAPGSVLAGEPAPPRPPTPRRPPSATAPAPPTVHLGAPAGPPTPSTPIGEAWLKRIGIGLVLLGVAFLFKHSIDQGWLTEPVRVGFGLAVAAALMLLGLRVRFQRPDYGQLLQGGGIAAFYISGFAAFQLYRLVSHPTALGYMAAVTAVAYLLSVRQGRVPLSIVATVGGLSTPFLLYTDAGSVPGLVGYTLVLVAGTSAIYLARGWRSLLWTSMAGGWLVFLVAGKGVAGRGDLHAEQLGILLAGLAFWALPVLRQALGDRNPGRWPTPPLPDWAGDLVLPRLHVHLLSVATPLIALAVSRTLPWDLSTRAWGLVTLAVAALFGLAGLGLRRAMAERSLARTQALAGLILLTLGLLQILKGHALLLSLAAEATALQVISRRLGDRGASWLAHLMGAALAPWLVFRLALPQAGALPFLNPQALTDLAVVAAALLSSGFTRSRQEALAYRLAAHLAILGWVLRELAGLEGGQGYVSLVWGAYAACLLVAGLRLDRSELRLAGLGTLMLVAAKLLLVDLAEVETLWRILLFLGFGGLFLTLGYYARTLWRRDRQHQDLQAPDR